jgi:hypothetical protein
VDYKFSIGLCIGFVVGGVGFVIGPSQWVGIAFLSLAAVWGFLFINPRSPIRGRWWSVSNKLGIGIMSYTRPSVGIGNQYITIYMWLRAMSDIQVDKIVLQIGHKHLVSDWDSRIIQGDETRYINFTRPQWFSVGQYEASLIAYTPYGFAKSGKFPVKVKD